MTLREKALAVLMLLVLNVVALSAGSLAGVLGLALAASFFVLSVLAAARILHA